MRNIKGLIQQVINATGYQITKFPKKQKVNKRDRDFMKLLQHYGIDLILDVGAANGGYVDWVRSLGYAHKIISFEPLDFSFKMLKAKTLKELHWEAVNLALGEVDETGNINVSGNLDSSSFLPMLAAHETAAPQTKVTHQEIVRKMRLDGFVHPWIDAASSIFLKLDVQGYEKQVLDGSENLMKRISGMQLEMSLVPLYAGQILFEEQLKICADLGYQLYYVRPGFADPTGRLLQFDGIFFRE